MSRGMIRLGLSLLVALTWTTATVQDSAKRGSPMTCMLGGKQYLVTAISGAGFPDAYSLP
jgi:hypothetical protein